MTDYKKGDKVLVEAMVRSGLDDDGELFLEEAEDAAAHFSIYAAPDHIHPMPDKQPDKPREFKVGDRYWRGAHIEKASTKPDLDQTDYARVERILCALVASGMKSEWHELVSMAIKADKALRDAMKGGEA